MNTGRGGGDNGSGQGIVIMQQYQLLNAQGF